MLTISLFMTKLSLNLPKGDTFTLCNACRIDAEPQKRANEMKVTRVLNFYSEAILPYSRILSLFFFTPHQDVRCYGCIMRFSSFFKCLSDGNSSIQFWLLEFVVLQNFAFQSRGVREHCYKKKAATVGQNGRLQTFRLL